MVKINLLPWRAQVRQRRTKKFLGQLLFAAMIGALVIALIYFPIARIMAVQQERLHYLQQAIMQEQQKMNALKIVVEEKKQIIDQINLIQGLQNDRFRLVRLLNILTQVMPKGAYLIRVEQQDNEILLQGKSTTNNALAELIKNLNDTKEFSSVALEELTGVDPVNAENKNFMLKIVEKQKNHISLFSKKSG